MYIYIYHIWSIVQAMQKLNQSTFSGSTKYGLWLDSGSSKLKCAILRFSATASSKWKSKWTFPNRLRSSSPKTMSRCPPFFSWPTCTEHFSKKNTTMIEISIYICINIQYTHIYIQLHFLWVHQVLSMCTVLERPASELHVTRMQSSQNEAIHVKSNGETVPEDRTPLIRSRNSGKWDKAPLHTYEHSSLASFTSASKTLRFSGKPPSFRETPSYFFRLSFAVSACHAQSPSPGMTIRRNPEKDCAEGLAMFSEDIYL